MMIWNNVKLATITLELNSGGRPKGGADASGTIPSLGAEHLDNNGGFNFKNIKYIPDGYFRSMRRGKIEQNDILIVKDGATTGKVSYVSLQFKFNEAAINEHLFQLKLNADLCLPKYCFYYLNSKKGNQLLMSDFRGATVGGISKEILNKVIIPLPPLHIQQQIADTLDKADALRQKDQQLLEKYDELAKSIFYDMFGDPVENDKGWKLIELGQLCGSFKYGTNAKSYEEMAERSIPVIRIPNVLNNTVSLSDLKYSILPEKELNDLLLKNGDLLFVRSNGNPNYIGRCAVYNHTQNVAYASYLIRARLKDKGVILPQFIQSVLSYETYRITIVKKATTTAGNYNINTVSLKSLPIITPPLKLQRKYEGVHRQLIKVKKIAQDEQLRTEHLFNHQIAKHFDK